MYVYRNIEARSQIVFAILLIGLCAHACMWVRGRVGVCTRIRACSLANPSYNAYAPYYEVVCGPSFSTTFFDIFGKKVIEHKVCVWIFSTYFV